MAEVGDNSDNQIQEETISSLTEDLKSKVHQSEMKQNCDTIDANTAEEKPEVETTDNANGETEITETNGHNAEDETKAENVSSTEQAGEAKCKETAEEKEDEKKTEEAQKKDQPLSTTVAKHYNKIPAGTKEGRKDSRIFYLRNFNNWVKSVTINEFLEKVKRKKRTSDEINVLDLACGKGGDLLKWDKGKVDHVIMADIAATSIEQCKERYNKLERDRRRGYHSRLFTTEFFAADCTKKVLSEDYKKKDIKLDLTSCQFAFHYSFESYEQAETMLKNACENLRVGGYFIGTTPDSNKLVKRIQECKEADSFGNSVFNIKSSSHDNFPLFGAKYMFYLEGVVDCPEFLVHFPTMEALAAKYNMKLVWKKSFHEIFKEFEREHAHLLNKMNALETYPAPGQKTLAGVSESQYKSASDYLEKKSCKQVGTLSADEWEVAGLYTAFAFEKMGSEKSSPAKDHQHSRKRHRDHSSDKRRSDSSSGKRSRKDEHASTPTEEVYEVKDEIYDDEADAEATAATSVATTETKDAAETTTSTTDETTIKTESGDAEPTKDAAEPSDVTKADEAAEQDIKPEEMETESSKPAEAGTSEETDTPAEIKPDEPAGETVE